MILIFCVLRKHIVKTHLDKSVTDESVYLSKYFDVPYRKDRSCYGGGILVYIINSHLLGIFYSPEPQDQICYRALNLNIEKAIDFTGNLVILGDLNEDLLNHSYHNLQDVLMVNSLKNIINVPTRGRALLDPLNNL